uniref:hypothetical protein n=1 Tax=Mycobacterium sp. HUMS_1102779 TaxID=3383487 RepID=UPI003899E8BB
MLNVASTIAFQPGPYQATYGASKAFVLSLSQALWAETRRRARLGRLAHRDLSAPGRARTRRGRGPARPRPWPRRGRARVALSGDGRRRTAPARPALGARERADAASRRGGGF